MRLLARISLSVDLLLGVLMLFSCTPQESSVATVASISVEPSSLTIAQGSRQPLSVSVQPAGAKYLYVSWSSSDPEVARVNKAGTLTAIKEGSATITAAIGEVTGTCRVTVAKNLTPVDKVLLSATSMTLGKGSSQTLTATVEPENAADKTIVWSSTDTGVATVSGGEVVAVGAGTCEIVAASASGTAEARCSVTVADIPVEALAFAGDSGLTQIVSAGSDYTLIVSYSPATTSDREILWKCSNPDMATVSEQGQGQATVTFATSALTVRLLPFWVTKATVLAEVSMSVDTISVVANIYPTVMRDLTRLCAANDYAAAGKLQVKLKALCDAMFCEVNPIPVKTAMSLMGYKVGGLRLPLTEMESANLERLKVAMRAHGLL